MWSSEYNPSNEIYYTRFNGTANLSTSMMASVAITKGHFLDLDYHLLESAAPLLLDHDES